MDGKPKAFLQFGGRYAIELLLKLHHKFCDQVIIVTDNKSLYLDIKDTKIVEDKIKYMGPLFGILYGLNSSFSEINFITACDSPFIMESVVEYLLSIAFNGKNYDVIIPFLKNNYQPLTAVYSKKCIPWIEKSLNNSMYRITDFFPNVKVKKVYEQEIIILDPELKSFNNINTPEEYLYNIKNT
ncbi:molybdenum cofactor guanylyltransferase [Candidatus Desantisbacteria bacterium]|nr:molybdenum cofactor guanylyltransferase [Candidatus Desantisbacteria bacterium]